jgi:tetratricopeptide (TPR) repeat protein
MSVKDVLALAAVVGLLVLSSPTLSASKDETLDELSAADRDALLQLRYELDRWSHDRTEMESIRLRMIQLMERNPNSFAVRLIDTERQWFDYSSALGFRLGGMSYIPVFLELHRQEPTNARALYQAAIGYIHTGDFAGAKPWLDKAAVAAPDDPWVDLARALWHGNQLQREQAVAAARMALSKSKGDALALSLAVRRIAHNWGIADQADAASIADTMLQVEPDTGVLTEALSLLIESYTQNPAHLAAAFALAERLAQSPQHSADLQLQLVRIAAFERIGAADPKSTAEFDTRLAKLVEIESVSEKARTLQLNLAIGDGYLERAEGLIADGKAAGMPRRWVGSGLVALHRAQRKHKEVVEVYEEYELPESDSVMESKAMTGGREEAKMYHARMVENEPSNPNRMANYAGFLFHFFGDYEQTIYHGSKAYEMWPTPFLANRLASAYLARAAHLLEFGNESDARSAYKEALVLKFDPGYVMQICYPLCEEISGVLTEFRETPL